MRYATWKLHWQPDERYGSGPEPVIAERGGNAGGAFFTGDVHDPIVGYVYSEVSLDDLDDWHVAEITAEEALALAQALDAEASMDAEGRIVFSVTGPVG
jgi:hypothetical protein